MPARRVNFGPCSEDGCPRDAYVKGLCQKHYLEQRDVGECSIDACTNSANAKGLCRTHYSRLNRNGSPDKLVKPPSGPLNWKIRPNGYVMARWKRDGQRFELSQHRVVMEEMLGRPLLPHENVHHKNGIKHDNDPSNLELWTVSQPAGQRVEDKIEWATRFLAEYGYAVSHA